MHYQDSERAGAGASGRPAMGNATSCQSIRRNWLYAQSLRLAGSVLMALSLAALPSTAARAEGAGILAPGDAVVTGFSGIAAPDGPPPPDADPLDYFYIDLDGASARVMRLGVPGGPPEGQMISAPTPHQVKARDVGQVFGVTLDDGRVPSIYLAATAAFGLRIVGADGNGDGKADRLKTGQPGAAWMPGQFGAGGPGGIYRVDGETGKAGLLATIPGNSGAGLGNIVFDKSSRQFFVSDLDTGLIHRLGHDGTVIDSFDHGTSGRAAAGLGEIADDGQQIDVTSPAFDTENPDTWGFTQPERRVWGMALHQGRLYYAVAEGPSVWSIGIEPDGSFDDDPQLEIEVTDTPAGTTISDITFDGQGRMYLAQRGTIRGSYDYSVFAESERAVVLRYARMQTDDPATPGDWVHEPETYAIGLPPEHRNASGGIALGYGHDGTGMTRRGACHATLWATGDNLRNDPAQADKLGDEGPLDIHGLQGNDVSLVRPENVPPLQSYFVDYDGQFGDTGKAGHVGDIEIWQPCEGSPEFGQLIPGYPPPGYEPPGYDDDDDDDDPHRRRRSNLKLDKRAVACWPIAGGKHRCGYLITVTNTGPRFHNAHIGVRDRVPAGTTAIFSSPLFTCGPGAPNYTCQSNASIALHPWEHVTIPVRVDVPDALAKSLNCRVRNRAEITFSPGGSRRNTDPTDDTDAATALLPAHLCQDPPGEKTNLKLTKLALSCFKIDDGKIRCGYHVRVWNTGPGNYNDKIEINESVPVGATPIFSGSPALGWNCVGGNPYTCTSNPVALSPGENALLIVRLDISQEQAKQWDCKLRNTARLTHAPGGSDQNTNPADDAASATAIIPAEICDPPKRTNLRITKRAFPFFCQKVVQGWSCGYAIRVWNTGPGVYNDKVEVRETLPFEPVDASWNGPWNCEGQAAMGNPDQAICTHPVVELQPGQSRLLHLKLVYSDAQIKQLGCKVPNRAEIIHAPGGSPQNTNPADDKASATALVPRSFCAPPVPSNLKLTKMSAQVGCNTTGSQQWRCVYNVLVRNMGPGNFSGPITVQDWVPAHPAGATMSFLGPWNCVGGGTNYDCTHPPVDLAPGQQVVLQATVFVSPGHYAQCKLQNMARIKSPLGAPKNTDGSDDLDSATADFAPMIVNGKPYCYTPVPAQCPPGFAWTGDRCGRGPEVVPPPTLCPPGAVGRWPRCREVEPECPRGTAGTYPDCRKPPVIVDPPRCRPGTIGRYPDCKPIVRPCPRGLIGTYPDCRKPPVVYPPKCRPGTVGRYPNCKPIVRPCPRGTTGTWPHCKKVESPRCPLGMVGRPPNCRRIDKPGSSIRPQQLRQWKMPSRGGPSRSMPIRRVR